MRRKVLLKRFSICQRFGNSIKQIEIWALCDVMYMQTRKLRNLRIFNQKILSFTNNLHNFQKAKSHKFFIRIVWMRKHKMQNLNSIFKWDEMLFYLFWLCKRLSNFDPLEWFLRRETMTTRTSQQLFSKRKRTRVKWYYILCKFESVLIPTWW